MKIVFWIIGILIGIALGIGILQYVASERIEVVELHTLDASNQEQTTRLWIVDHDGLPYLRGDDGSGWVQRLKASEQIELTRSGARNAYTWEVRPANTAAVNQLMRHKYTWGDQVITAFVGDRSESNMIALLRIDG
jgi:ABC-type antimicrobial peptide transport system permease subunit